MALRFSAAFRPLARPLRRRPRTRGPLIEARRICPRLPGPEHLELDHVAAAKQSGAPCDEPQSEIVLMHTDVLQEMTTPNKEVILQIQKTIGRPLSLWCCAALQRE